MGEVYECIECGESYRNASYVLHLDTMEAQPTAVDQHVCIYCAEDLGLFEEND